MLTNKSIKPTVISNLTGYLTNYSITLVEKVTAEAIKKCCKKCIEDDNYNLDRSKDDCAGRYIIHDIIQVQ